MTVAVPAGSRSMAASAAIRVAASGHGKPSPRSTTSTLRLAARSPATMRRS